MKYGVPYSGSKSRIAAQIVANLPPAEYFVDLFFGGGAVTHAAILSGKYEKFIANDLDGRGLRAFINAINGAYKNETRWVGRSEFLENRELPKDEQDPFIALCWSFGNNMADYLYSRKIEDWKHGFHNAVFFNDYSLLESLGVFMPECPLEGYAERMAFFKKAVPVRLELQHAEATNRLKRLEWEPFERSRRLAGLERLLRCQSLTSLGDSDLIVSFKDYREVDIPPNSVIYCDPPYKGTRKGTYRLEDYDAFYDWALSQRNIFISEYSMPPGFRPYASWNVSQLAHAKGGSGNATETLWVPA